MPLSRYEIGQRAAAYLNPADVPTDTQYQLLLSDINGALTEISHHAPGKFFAARRSTGRLGSSTAMTVTATQDSEILTLATPAEWQDKMLGCALLVTGDSRINRVEQRLLVKAGGTITFTGVPIAGTTITIGTITYTYRALASLPYEITIYGSAELNRGYLLDTMRADLSGLSSRPYVDGTEIHPTVTGVELGTASIALTALTGGTDGNAIALSETSAAITVTGAGFLTGGTQDTVRMEMPFAGTTGSTTATVYYESWPLRSDEKSVTGPVLCETLGDGTRTRLRAFAGPWEEWQEQQDKSVEMVSGASMPQYYLVESNQSFVGTDDDRQFVTPTNWLRLSRWPSEAVAVSYMAALRPPQFALADITTNAGNGRLSSGLPIGWDDMALLPIVMWRIMAWLNFPEDVQYAQESIRTGVFEKYKRAIEFIKAQAPQSETTDSMCVG